MIVRRGKFILTWRIVLPADDTLVLKYVETASLYVGLFVLVPAVVIEVAVIIFPIIIYSFSTIHLDTFYIFEKQSHVSCFISISSLNCFYLRSCCPYITEINEFTFLNLGTPTDKLLQQIST